MHAVEVSGRAFPSQRVFGGVSDAQMRVRPGPGLVAGREQVLDEGWVTRMEIPWRIIGTGMTDDEVSALTAGADVAAVRAYRTAVGRRTREVVQAMPVPAWEETIGEDDIRRAGTLGALRDWKDGAGYPWLGWTRAEQLASSALRHNAAHFGEAVTIRGLAGMQLAI